MTVPNDGGFIMKNKKIRIQSFVQNDVLPKIKRICDCFTKSNEKRKNIAIAVGVLVAVGLGALITSNYILPSYHYSAAKKAIQSREFLEAYSHLNQCRGYKQADLLLEDFVVFHGKETSDGDVETERKFEYDKKGNLTKVYQYDSKGNLSDEKEYKYEYDEEKRVAQMSVYFLNSDSDLVLDFKNKYDYDDDGKLSTITTYYNESEDDGNGKTVRTYNKKGDVSSIIHYEKGDVVSEKSVYHKNGKLKEQISGDTIITYNKKGGLIDYKDDSDFKFKRNILTGSSDIYFYGDNNNVMTEWHFDKDGNMTEEMFYNENENVINRYVYKYDNKQLKVKKGYNEEKKLSQKQEYNEFGNPTSVWFKDSQMIYKYKYDKYGVLVKETMKWEKIRNIDTSSEKTEKGTSTYKYADTVLLYLPGYNNY